MPAPKQARVSGLLGLLGHLNGAGLKIENISHDYHFLSVVFEHHAVVHSVNNFIYHST